jgi:hypothetical protein
MIGPERQGVRERTMAAAWSQVALLRVVFRVVEPPLSRTEPFHEGPWWVRR